MGTWFVKVQENCIQGMGLQEVIPMAWEFQVVMREDILELNRLFRACVFY